MNVNGVTNEEATYAVYQTGDKPVKEKTEVAKDDAKVDDKGVIYEPSEDAKAEAAKANKALIAKLKADSEARINQLQDIVTKLITKQGGAFADANGMWNLLREGKLEVDPETRAQAQADIAEDGYFGVKQTSDRIIDFAKALCNGDDSKLNDMLEAFKKGYEQAEKTWGGELPDICKQTYDAVLEKFDNLINGGE